MDAIEAIKIRCSIREFDQKAVPRDVIEKIVDCGRLAPTARKEEPWEFIAVTDKKKLKEVADITDHGKFIAFSAFAVMVCSKDTKYYLEDCCAATENMLVAAASFGVGSCWVAGDKKHYCQDVMRSVNIPAGYKLVSIIAFGYPVGKLKPLAKRRLQDVLHWERF